MKSERRMTVFLMVDKGVSERSKHEAIKELNEAGHLVVDEKHELSTESNLSIKLRCDISVAIVSSSVTLGDSGFFICGRSDVILVHESRSDADIAMSSELIRNVIQQHTTCAGTGAKEIYNVKSMSEAVEKINWMARKKKEMEIREERRVERYKMKRQDFKRGKYSEKPGAFKASINPEDIDLIDEMIEEIGLLCGMVGDMCTIEPRRTYVLQRVSMDASMLSRRLRREMDKNTQESIQRKLAKSHLDELSDETLVTGLGKPDGVTVSDLKECECKCCKEIKHMLGLDNDSSEVSLALTHEPPKIDCPIDSKE